MDLNEFAKKAQMIAEERPRELAQEYVNAVQGVYDRVFAVAQGRSAEEIRALLTQEWMTTFPADEIKPGLLDKAETIAKGEHVTFKLQLRT